VFSDMKWTFLNSKPDEDILQYNQNVKASKFEFYGVSKFQTSGSRSNSRSRDDVVQDTELLQKKVDNIYFDYFKNIDLKGSTKKLREYLKTMKIDNKNAKLKLDHLF
jgi:hypothetical protein